MNNLSIKVTTLYPKVNDIIYVNDKIIRLREQNGLRPKCFVDGYVIKFDDREDWKQSSREIEKWFKIKPADRKYFAKIVKYSRKHGYVVQERIKFKKGRRSKEAFNIVRTLMKRYRLGDIHHNSFNDNWGLREDGTPVIYDWGYPGRR